MNTFMASHFAPTIKLLAALFTGELWGTLMDHFMSLHALLGDKPLAANIARVRPLACMTSLVNFKSSFGHKPPPTKPTHVGPLISMFNNMSFQPCSMTKSFFTIVTLEGFLPQVFAHVRHQGSLIAQASAAHIAHLNLRAPLCLFGLNLLYILMLMVS